MGRRRFRGAEGTPSLAERLHGRSKIDRGSLLSQSDRRLIRELTEALRENSALLRGDQQEESVDETPEPEPGPRPVDEPQEETQSGDAAPQSA